MNEYYPDHVLTIPNATPETKDAAQYMFYRGRKQWNLCGQFCVAFCMQDEAYTDNIDEFLAYWEAQSPRWYNTLFKDKLSRTTGIYDLTMMLKAYDVAPVMLDAIPFKIDAVSLALRDYHLILGVSINGANGMLTSNGIRHWVVVEEMEVINSLHAIVKIYNPFDNAYSPYKWEQILSSVGTYRQGLWIER